VAQESAATAVVQRVPATAVAAQAASDATLQRLTPVPAVSAPMDAPMASPAPTDLFASMSAVPPASRPRATWSGTSWRVASGAALAAMLVVVLLGLFLLTR
jgi:hypothetical protein